MSFIRTPLARRLALPLAGALLATALGTTRAAADTQLTLCTSATNQSSGQTLQICANFGGVGSSDQYTAVAYSCVAVSGPASVTTTVGCYTVDTVTGQQYPAIQGPVTAPGDTAATGGTIVDEPLDPVETCVTGSAVDALGNTVSIPPYTCDLTPFP